jgi:hypothetical protein
MMKRKRKTGMMKRGKVRKRSRLRWRARSRGYL